MPNTLAPPLGLAMAAERVTLPEAFVVSIARVDPHWKPLIAASVPTSVAVNSPVPPTLMR